MPKPPPGLSAYFSELGKARVQKLGKKGWSKHCRAAAKAGWIGMSKRQRSLEMRRRAKVRRQNRIERMKLDEALMEKIARRKAGLDE